MVASLCGSSAMFLIVVLFCFLNGILSTKLCPNDNSWYDANNGKCRPCEPCGTKALELEPCSEYRNTMCVDLAVFRFDFNSKPNIVSARKELPLKQWHEMETSVTEELIEGNRLNHAELQATAAASAKIQHDDLWDVAVVIVLCLTLAAVLGAIAALMLKQSGRWSCRSDNRKATTRARLFSRDRLNTTEYMNNLATLDRRLAMDEILEKRKKAIFEPQLLSENIYTDDVFVDLSGIPRHYDDFRNEELDLEPSRSLLRIHERQ